MKRLKWPFSVMENTFSEVLGEALTIIALTSSTGLNLKSILEGLINRDF